MLVDLIITYCEETALHPAYDKWMQSEIMLGKQSAKNQQAFGSERTRNWDNLRYWFRGVEKNCDWVNNIFFIVADENHIPQWLNTEHPKLRIVFHRDFIPAEFLPTYNIRIIEMFEHRIKGLSEHFIYCDDDFFFLNPIKQTQFFGEDGTSNNSIVPITWESHKGEFGSMLNVTQDFLVKHYGLKKDIWFKIGHLPEPRIKSAEEKIFNDNKEEFLNNLGISRFRRSDNYIIILIYNTVLKLSLLKTGVEPNNELYKESQFMNVTENTDFEQFRNKQMACFNDSQRCNNFALCKQKLLKFLDSMFPNKSSFEK